MNAHLASVLAAGHVRDLRREAERRRALTGPASLGRSAAETATRKRLAVSAPMRRRLGFTLVEVGLRLLAG